MSDDLKSMVFTIDSQHVTDPKDLNLESLCGQPVGDHDLSLTIDMTKPTCERCLRILADRLADARLALTKEAATHG